MRVAVVIVTYDGRDRLRRALASLEGQSRRPDEVIVVDNASTDGTMAMLRDEFPAVELVETGANLGFGRAVNRGAAAASSDIIVLINNDAVCDAAFVAEITEPFVDPGIGMVAGVLLQEADPTRIDTAGLVLDRTLRSWEFLGDESVEVLDAVRVGPFGPCGGAAAYRSSAFSDAGGFDEALFAYWEDVDLAIRLHAAGWRCAFASRARALHAHGATTGAMSPRMRELDAFGRGFVVGRYGVMRRPIDAAAAAVLDWPGLAVHAVFRQELGPWRERRKGVKAGRAGPLSPTRSTPAVGVAEGLQRQWGASIRRLTGRAPKHFAG